MLTGEQYRQWWEKTRKAAWVAGALIVVLTVLAYLPALPAGFVWDDDDYVTQNQNLRNLAGLVQIWFKVGAVPQYYPLVHTTFWLEYHLWELNPLGYHLVNVFLHAFAAVLFWRVLARLQVPGAWLAAAIFALHPVHVESVAWITERKNVLSALFYFAAALAYLQFAEGNGKRASQTRRWYYYCGALVLFIAAMLSKTVTASLPAAILLVQWWKRGRLRSREIVPLLPFVAIGGVLGTLTVWLEKYHVGAQGGEWSLPLVERFLIAGRALWFYAGKLVWPAELTFIYPRWSIEPGAWWQWVFPIAAIAVIGALFLLRNRFGRGAFVSVAFFVGTLGPALGFIDVYSFRFSFVADHFQYLASAGLIALAAAGITKAPRAIPIGLLGLLALLTWRQSAIYYNVETLWRDTLAKNPSAWIAHNNLGNVLKGQGKGDESAAHYRAAIKLKPDYPEAFANLGAWHLQNGRIDEAMSNFQAALEIYPKELTALNNLGNVLLSKGRLEEAIVCFRKSLEVKPNDPEILSNLGAALAGQKQYEEAIPQYEAALRVKADSAPVLCNLGNALAAAGRFDEAMVKYQNALRVSPDYFEAHVGWGNILVMTNKTEEAIQHYREGLQLNPEDPEAHFYLGYALARLGHRDEAVAHLNEALRIKPHHEKARRQLQTLGVQPGTSN